MNTVTKLHDPELVSRITESGRQHIREMVVNILQHRDIDIAMSELCEAIDALDYWRDMSTAPKPTDFSEHWILGIAENGEQRVMRWCVEYPSDGCWLFAYEPTDYIPGLQTILPVGWMPLPIGERNENY
jgi:hypothetical protein